jgi:hypothetical protein
MSAALRRISRVSPPAGRSPRFVRAWTGDRLAAVLWAVIAAAPLAAGVAARGLLSAAPRRLTVWSW